MKGKHILRIMMVVFVAVFILAGYNAVVTYVEYKEADDTYDRLQDTYVETVPETGDITEEPTGVSDNGGETEEPEKAMTVGITVDFEALRKENADVVGWLYCPDTPINYPVVQGEDNNQYLRADLKGKYLVSGTIFVDYRNGEIGQDRNYIIYGHNMKNSTMFGTLVKYKQQAYYDTHPVIFYLTPENNYAIELIAGLVVANTDPVYNVDPTAAELTAYLEQALQKSSFQAGVCFEEGDRIVTLSTCSYEFDNARYVVIGRLAECD